MAATVQDGRAFGAFAFDGRTNYTITPPGTWQPDAVLVQAPVNASMMDGALAFSVRAPRPLNWTYDAAVTLPSRNGIIAPVYAELDVLGQAPQLSYSLLVVPWQKV